jgi:hypothetical protein
MPRPAQPVDVSASIRSSGAHDERFHGALKERAEADLAAHDGVRRMKQISGTYSEIEWVKSDDESTVGHASRLPKNGLAVASLPNLEMAGDPPSERFGVASAPALQEQDAPNAVKLDSTEWKESVQKLAAIFGGGQSVAAGVPPAKLGRARPPGAPACKNNSETSNTWDQIQTGELSPLQEDEDRYYATAVIGKGKDRLKLATIAWLKQPFDS